MVPVEASPSRRSARKRIEVEYKEESSEEEEDVIMEDSDGKRFGKR